jgi:glycosyltransferase involved in cell wall biosynthesis
LACCNENRSVFFGYDTGSLEILDALAETDCFTIVDQIDPGKVQTEIARKEVERWPGWALKEPTRSREYEDRRQAEWQMASAVVVNSEWSKRALIQQDVPRDKINVVPLAFEPHGKVSGPVASPAQRPLRILWLGSVNLSKGIQYLIQSACLLEGSAVEFKVVGSVQITDQAVVAAPSNVTFEGRVPRDDTATYYRWADIFILPTLSDGFAITQLEAMAYGLPVIVTPNCGRVVTDGQDGFLVPPRDPEAIAEIISRLIENRDRIRLMSKRALKTVQQFSIDRVANELISIVEKETA